jgi:hypothetical protein
MEKDKRLLLNVMKIGRDSLSRKIFIFPNDGNSTCFNTPIILPLVVLGAYALSVLRY